MCRNYDAGECVEEDCTGRITCHDFTDQRCREHSYNGVNPPWLEDDEEPKGRARLVSWEAPVEAPK